MKKFSVGQTSINKAYYLKVLFVSAALLFSAISMSVFGQTELVFKQPTLVSGIEGKNGAIYRFSNVSVNMDALVTIKGRSSSAVVLDNIDVDYYGWDKSFQPRLGCEGGSVTGKAKWWMEFQVDFVKGGTNTLATVSKFDCSALDVDGDGCQIREYYHIGGAQTYSMENPTELEIAHLSGGIKEMMGPVKNYENIDPTATTVMFTCNYLNKNSLTFKIGAESIGNGTSNAAMRYNSLWFRSFNFTTTSTLPVSIINWNASYAGGSVSLKWSTTFEKNASHFIIERSFNGVEYADVAMLVANGNSDVQVNYAFTDNIPEGNAGTIYYRLRATDLDGAARVSDIRIVRLGKGSNVVKVAAYPNPVVNEVRVTIPQNWQGKPLTYQVVTMNGQVVKSVNVQMANQTQVIAMNEVPAGVYVIKVSNGTETGVQQVMKAK
jgi:Secretion system C-terminal sorting domain